MTARAVVFGGGGAVGNAWMIGVVAGLYETGLDVTEADLIIGTSAGATAAAQVTGSARPTTAFADIIAEAAQPTRGENAVERPNGPRPSPDHMQRTDAIFSAATDAADLRRKMGDAALALDSGSDGSAQKRWREIVAARLPIGGWPHKGLLITAVEIGTGNLVTFGPESGVDLADAVAASTSNGFGVPPYRIGDKQYIDGGYPSSSNVALAVRRDRVLVLSPFGTRSRAPNHWRMHVTAQVDDLRANGSRVEAIFPDSDAQDVFGFNMMDLSARRPSAQAGFKQGTALGVQLAGFWR